jgi:hypothetical protein
MTLSPDLLAILVCPACRGPLAPQGEAPAALRCVACAIDYPVRDGIPILIVDDGIPVPPATA